MGRGTIFVSVIKGAKQKPLVANKMMDFCNDQFKPHGAAHLTNTGGIEIEFSRDADGLRYRFNYGQDLDKEPIIEAEIVYRENPDLDGSDDDEGQGDYPCFIVGEGENETVYFLADFMRV